jgi:hypothetical protein
MVTRTRRIKIDPFDTYTSVLAVITAALLLVASGLAKKQLVWKRPRRIHVRRRWRR